MDKPEALRLADLIRSRHGNDINDEAAAELRRQHEENERLREQRDALLAEHQQTLALQQRSYEREIQLEVEAEREACADICDAHASCEGIAQRCAAAIRARGQA